MKAMEIMAVTPVTLDISLHQMVAPVRLALVVSILVQHQPVAQLVEVVATLVIQQPPVVVAVLDMVSHLDHALSVVLEPFQQVELIVAKIVMVESGQMQDLAVAQVNSISIFFTLILVYSLHQWMWNVCRFNHLQ